MLANHGWQELVVAATSCIAAFQSAKEAVGAAADGQVWHEVATETSEAVTHEVNIKTVLAHMEQSALQFNGDDMEAKMTVLSSALGELQAKGTSYGEICGWGAEIDSAPWSLELEETQTQKTTLQEAYNCLVDRSKETINRCKVSKLEVRIALMLKKQYPGEALTAKEMKEKECEKIQTWMMKRETQPGGIVQKALWAAFQEGLGTF